MLKVLNYNKKDSLKTLEVFLNKRKIVQKSQTKVVSAIIKKVKKKVDTAVLKKKKKYSKHKIKKKKIFFS